MKKMWGKIKGMDFLEFATAIIGFCIICLFVGVIFLCVVFNIEEHEERQQIYEQIQNDERIINYNEVRHHRDDFIIMRMKNVLSLFPKEASRGIFLDSYLLMYNKDGKRFVIDCDYDGCGVFDVTGKDEYIKVKWCTTSGKSKSTYRCDITYYLNKVY